MVRNTPQHDYLPEYDVCTDWLSPYALIDKYKVSYDVAMAIHYLLGSGACKNPQEHILRASWHLERDLAIRDCAFESKPSQ